MSSQATLFEETLTRYQELVGYAIPAVFSAVAASCETQAEAFLAVAVMVSILARTPE